MDTPSIDTLLSSFPVIRFEAGERIKRPMEGLSNIVYVTSGYIKIYIYTEEGEKISLLFLNNTHYKYVFFGYNTYMDKYYIEALTPVEIIRIPRKEFEEISEKTPEVVYSFTQSLHSIVRAQLYQMEWLKTGDAYIKVTAMLCNLTKSFSIDTKSGKKIDFILTHQMIAEHTGLTRESVTNQMKKLKEKGLIETADGAITITDLTRLRNEVNIDIEE